jgi:hypothetical protein
MSVYKKLQQARLALQNTKLSKSGKNKFAGYEYFELSDFLPQVTDIFNRLGLCGIVSFTAETAYLTVHETEGDGFVTFTSPLVMAENAKGQAIQSLGSTHTYFRRYLWLMCMEITENDMVDATTGGPEPLGKTYPNSAPVTKIAEVVAPPKKAVEAKPIAGQKGEWQIVAPAAPADGAITDWLELIKTSSHMLLDLCTDEADVMQIFKKNKVLFDTVKGHDAVFFKEMMGKFTDTKNKLIKE